MARPELGTKRVDPVTGKKFYDLNKDPIVSPFTGQSYPISAFEAPVSARASSARGAAVVREVEEPEIAEVGDVELVSLEDADAEVEAGAPVVAEAEDVDIEEDEGIEEAEPFLEEEEEGEDDVADLLGADLEEDEET